MHQALLKIYLYTHLIMLSNLLYMPLVSKSQANNLLHFYARYHTVL